jgi:uncharacterized repeat protein (TIGR01451 family)
MTDAPDPLTLGNDVTYTITVANGGTAAGTNVVLNDTLPAGASLVSWVASQGFCNVTPVSCPLGTIGAGASATVTLVVRPSSAGTAVNSASAFGTESEVDSSDNYASAQTTVVAPAGSMHIGDLDGSAALTKKNWKATVRITAHDAQHAIVAGATISGRWSGGYAGTASCVTTSTGVCSVSSGNAKLTSTIAFDVTAVSYSNWTYSASSNHDPDGDSNGTHIVVAPK